MSAIQKLYLSKPPVRQEKAWQVTFKGTEVAIWVPYSVINGFNPGQLSIEIQAWWLEKNNIKLK